LSECLDLGSGGFFILGKTVVSYTIQMPEILQALQFVSTQVRQYFDKNKSQTPNVGQGVPRLTIKDLWGGISS
jgi:hypothetical protein